MMLIGCAHSAGRYTYPAGSGTQFSDGWQSILALGLPAVKVYATQSFATDYPLHTWSASPTSLKTLFQTTEYQALFAAKFQSYVLTAFTFSTPANNWWRDAGGADNARLKLMGDEFQEAAEYLLTTYNGSGKEFIFANWEGDWAFMDAFTPDTYVLRRQADFYLAFLSRRQRAIEDARRAVAHSGVTVQHAVEVNRVSDAPGHRRIVTDILKDLTPDLVSWSAYDGFISTYGYGANQAEWEALADTYFTRGLRTIKAAAPKSRVYIGEAGFEEARIAIDRPSYNVDQMIRKLHSIAKAEGCSHFLYWQVFDNELDGTTPEGVKGYYLKRPSGATSVAGATLAALAGGG